MCSYIKTVPYFFPGMCWQLFGCHGRRKAKPWWQTGEAICVVWYIEACGALRPVLVTRLTQRFSSAGGTSHSQVAGRVGRRYRLYILAGPDVRCWWWAWHSPNWTGRSAYVHVQHWCFSTYSSTLGRYSSWMCQHPAGRRCTRGEVEYFRIIEPAGNVFLQCSVNGLAGKDNSQTEESLLMTLQGDSA